MQQQQPGPRHPRVQAIESFLGASDRALFIVIGFLLLAAAAGILLYAVGTFVSELFGNPILAVINLFNNLLLALIFLEVLSTVRGYLITGVTSIRVFIGVGIISAIRRILDIGAESAVAPQLQRIEFRELLLDLVLNALVVLALATAFFLVSRAGGLTSGTKPAYTPNDDMPRTEA